MASTDQVAEAGPAPAVETDWPRIRFAVALALYGGTLGAAVILVNFLTRFEDFEVAQHLSFGASLLFGTGGALAGVAVAGPLAYLIFGGLPKFYRSRHRRRPRSLMTWLTLGFGFGVMLPIVMGAVFLPTAQHVEGFLAGIVSVPGLLTKSVDLIGLFFSFAVILGFRLLVTGILAGGLFAVGGWAIDRLNLSEDPTTAKYGTWAMAAILSVAVMTVVALGSESFLGRLG